MQHNGCLFTAVLVDILQVELRGQAEVKLACAQRIFRSDGRFHVHVKLRAVEGSLADLFRILDPQLVQHIAQSAFRLVPHFVILVILYLVFRITQAQDAAVVRDMEIFIDITDQVDNAGHLILDLVRRHEQVGIVLAEMPAAFDSLQRAAGLKPEVVRDFADPDRQVAVGMQPVGIDHHMVRAVHRPEYEALAFHFHCREHVFLVMIPVAACAVQVHCADAGRHHVLITEQAFFFLDIVLQFHPDRISLWQEHGEPFADQVVCHEQLHILADPAVVPGLCLLDLAFVFLQFVRVPEGNAVQPRQHFIPLVILPVGAGNGCQLERFQGLCIAQVGADAHVDVVTLLVKCDHGILSQVRDMLDLVDFSAVLHQLYRFVPGQRIDLEGQVLLHDLLHFRFDRRQILIRQLHIAQVDIIVKSFFRGRPVCKVRVRIDPLHSLRHDVRRRVPQNLKFLFFGAFRNMSVVVDDLHCFPLPFVLWSLV